MKKTSLLLLLLLLVGCKNPDTTDKTCEKFSKDYTPKNLEETFMYFDCNWPDNVKNEFKNKTEDELALLHHGLGTTLRNNWGLWKQKNELCQYFHKLKVNHPDDISTIIIKSYHRKLNDKPIDLKAQVNYYIEYWKNNKWKSQKDTTHFENDFETDF